jgi:hypothetical protein
MVCLDFAVALHPAARADSAIEKRYAVLCPNGLQMLPRLTLRREGLFPDTRSSSTRF